MEEHLFGVYDFSKDDGKLSTSNRRKFKIAEKICFPYFPEGGDLDERCTTNMEVAKLIPKKLSLTVFTPALMWRWHCLNIKNVEVFSGGKALHEAKFAVGGTVVNNAGSKLRVDLLHFGHWLFRSGFLAWRNLTGRVDSGEAGDDRAGEKKRWFFRFQINFLSIQNTKPADLTEVAIRLSPN